MSEPSTMLDHALAYAADGLHVFPCVPLGKEPLPGSNGFMDATRDPEIIRAWWTQNPDYNIGVAPDRSGCFVVDVDPPRGEDTLAELELQHSMLPATRTYTTPRGGRHLWFRGKCPSSVGTDKRGLGPKVDTRGYGGYTILPPSRVRYENGHEGEYQRLNEHEIAAGPKWIAETINARQEHHDAAANVELDTPAAVARATTLLRGYVKAGDVAVEGNGGDDRTYRVSCEVLNLGLSPQRAWELIRDEWNPHCVPAWDADELAVKVRNASEYAQNDAGAWAVAPGAESFKHIAATVSDVASPPAERGSGFPSPSLELMSGSVAISEGEMVLYFASCYRDKLRFDHTSGKWFACRFNGEDSAQWIALPERIVWNEIRKRHRDVVTHTHTITDKDAKAMMQKSFIAHVADLAKGHEDIALTSARWDADPWMLNTPGGIVDLRTGELRPTRPDDYCTKSAAVTPDLDADCPLWRKFLRDITADDSELQSFLQLVAGYCLTGVTSEHAMFFGYGTGGNGKGVFLNTLSRIMADYAVAAPVDTFTQSHSDRHPTELAMLRGARLVAAQETDQGRRWAEAKIKALTGGDPIRARFMHQDFFEYVPQFKLIITGNHKPRLENVDEAMRRRLHLVPFTVTIPEHKRDPELSHRLKDEWPAILAWAIAGCVDWQLVGLSAPPAVTDATREYFEDQDPLAEWIAERCVRDPAVWSPVAELFRDYEMFLVRQRVERESVKRFSERLESHGFKRGRRKDGGVHARGFSGIALKEPLDHCEEVPS